MAGFLITDFDLFTKYPDLSDGARFLYSYINYCLKIKKTDSISFTGDTDPRPVLNISKKVLMKRTQELRDAGLIHTEGKGWEFRVYLGAQMVTENKEEENTRCPNGNRDGAQTVTETVPKREPSPLYINIEQLNNKHNTLCVINIPTLQEVREEIAARKYRIADPQKFLDYNEANGWRIKDWKKALALWAKNEGKQRQGIRSASITGAEAGIIYDCAIDIKQQDPAQITAEEISAEYIQEDKTDYTIETDLDAIIDIFGG